MEIEMGWTTGPRPWNITEWLRQQYTWETDDQFYRPLETAVIALTEAYIAVEIVDKVTGAREVRASTMQLRFTRDSYEQFGYKCVDETSGPIIRCAPRKILELLTPTDNENAQNWRADCWARIERREQNRLAKGELIELDEPMRFTNDREYTLFRLEDGRRNIFAAVSPEKGYEVARVRISNWRDRRFTRLQGRRLAELKDAWKEAKVMKEQRQSFANRFLEQVDRMFDGAPAKSSTQRPFETWTRAEVDSEIARLRPLVPSKGTGVDEVTWFELQNFVADLNDEDAALYLKELDYAMPSEPYLAKMLTIAVEAHHGQTDRGGAP